MKQVNIGWFGDSQLDFAQYGLTRRRDDFIQAVDSALRDMAGRDIRTVIHTGDFLQSNRPSPYTMAELQKMQKWLEESNMTVLVVSGNHDNAQPHWINVINAGGALGFQLLDHKLVESDGIKIYGVPNMSREAFLKLEFQPADVLVMHQAITQFIDFPMPNGIDVADLPFDKYQVIAIGDIHITRIEPVQALLPDRAIKANCLIGYSGATELNSKTEPSDKYWIEVGFEQSVYGSVMNGWSKHRISTRPIIRLKINDPSEVDACVDFVKEEVEKGRNVDNREPIVFVEYNSMIPKVIERFRENFDPDKYVLRFEAVFVAEKEQSTAIEATSTLSIADLLKREVPQAGALYPLASQLFNPDLDAGHIDAAIESYIADRLQPTVN